MRSTTRISSLVAVVAAVSFVAPAATGAEEAVPPAAPAAVAAPVANPDCAAEPAQEIEALFAVAGPPVCEAEAAAPAPAAQPELEPILLQGPPPIRRFCRCGCGAGCATDADCGPGGKCVAFVSCC